LASYKRLRREILFGIKIGLKPVELDSAITLIKVIRNKIGQELHKANVELKEIVL